MGGAVGVGTQYWSQLFTVVSINLRISRYCIPWFWHSFIFYCTSEAAYTWVRISQGGATFKLVQYVYSIYTVKKIWGKAKNAPIRQLVLENTRGTLVEESGIHKC